MCGMQTIIPFNSLFLNRQINQIKPNVFIKAVFVNAVQALLCHTLAHFKEVFCH